ncbi:MAG: condensation domain-containing protein, partial [Actinoallomurus sp.]
MSSTRRPKRFSADRLQQVHREAGLAAADGQAEPGRSADPAEAGLPDHGQEDIWFFEQFTPEALVHQVALVVRIDGPVVLPALRRAVRSLVERHEALRARYSVVDGAPRLTIAPAPGDDAVLHDRTEERAWGDLLDREVHRPFDLATGPLVRFVLGRPAGGRHELLIVLHHIIADGRTLVLLQRDLVAAYTAAVRGDEPPSGSSGDLRDIVGGRRAAVDRHWVADQLKRRIAELDDLPAAAERWPSFGRPAAEGSDPFAADSVAITLPAPLAADVRSIAAAERATPLMIWLTALTVLIHRVSATDDVVVGTVMDGRRDDASRDLAGYLANVVALRIRPAVDSTWRDVLRAVRSSVLAAFDDSDVPFRHVVERVSPERRPDVHPVFQILLTPQQAQDPPTPVDGVTFAVTERLSRRSLYELEFHLLDGPGATTGRLRFRTRSLDREAAQRTAERFVRLVGELTRDPDGRFDANDVLSTAERQDAVGDGRVTVTSRPDGDTVHRRFESFADAMPDACAVECSELRVTYGELDEDANRLARRLRAGGLRPEDRVGILPARADQWVRAALAVLKSGGAYVPLDGAWPGALLAEVCADAGIAMVVSDDAHLAAAAVTGAPVVRLDDTVAESSGRLDEPAG